MGYWSISSVVLKQEAEKLGLHVEIVSKKKNAFYVSGQGKKILFKSTDFGGNSSLGLKLVKDKELTYALLEQHNLPIAKSHYMGEEEYAGESFGFLESFNFPLIIKPLYQGHGNGVMMHILSLEELKQKLSTSFETYDRMIIQEEIAGDEIRILVMQGKVLLARNRIPAMIVGDGIHTIEQLIHIENKVNTYRGAGYEKPLSYIEIDNELISFIEKQGLSKNTIPDTDQDILLRGNSNTGTGGTMVDVTDLLHEEIKKICIQSCKIFGLELAGVDIITTDLTKPLHETGGVILELNSTPGIGGERELTMVNTGHEIMKRLFF